MKHFGFYMLFKCLPFWLHLLPNLKFFAYKWSHTGRISSKNFLVESERINFVSSNRMCYLLIFEPYGRRLDLD